ncbi:peptidoglycan-binding protein [Archangium sp.]|uniref:peptidoglycan-binding protein n=1 Tax=Archangium sp. TaxID=1872627 RepID=UPI00389A8289
MTTTSATSAQRTQAAHAPAVAHAASNPNAILSKYHSTGASAATARQDGLQGGVAASHKMAMTDLPKMKKYADEFAAAGKKYNLPPALLAAIASRESRGGSALDSRGFGDHGNGFGLMQVDKRFHTLKGGPFSAAHVDQAAGILKSYLNQVKSNHPSWPPEQQLRGAVAAYNSGVGNVQTIKNMDVGTTGNDYSNDVWARAQALAPHFGGKAGGTGETGGTQGTGHTGGSHSTGTLKEGSHGPAVTKLQKQLEKLGFDVGKVDGDFGPKTEHAVKSFQTKHHLEADGVAGSKTHAAIEKALEHLSHPKPTHGDGFEHGKDKWKPAPALADVKSGKEHLHQGMEGGSVRHMQKLLGVETDGKFGPGTKKAVADFQREHHLVSHDSLGSVGPKTLAAMEKAFRAEGAGSISAQGRKQMEALLHVAQQGSAGRRPDGLCLKHVGDFLDRTSYGKIGHGAAPRLPMAKDFGNWLNAHYKEKGLKKLNLDNPYKAPPGSIVVVRAGTPGTHHPTAGDIVVVGRNGHFYNGGEMGYGGSQNFPKGNHHVIGIFAPA